MGNISEYGNFSTNVFIFVFIATHQNDLVIDFIWFWRIRVFELSVYAITSAKITSITY